LKTKVLVWWCGWNDWLSGSCRGATVWPVQAWKSDVKLISSYYIYHITISWVINEYIVLICIKLNTISFQSLIECYTVFIWMFIDIFYVNGNLKPETIQKTFSTIDILCKFSLILTLIFIEFIKILEFITFSSNLLFSFYTDMYTEPL